MIKIAVLLGVVMYGCSVQAMPSGREANRYSALAMLETGNNDRAIGKKAKEVSRYSIRPDVWLDFSNGLPLYAATNPFTAIQVGEALMKPRVMHFIKKHGRSPTDLEWVLLWHCPARVRHPTAEDRDYALRFSNLLNRGV